MIKKLKEILANRQVQRISDSERRASAVLVPVFLKDGQYHLLFIQRTNRVAAHKGQISFPGGAYEQEDGSLLKTALRESEEEVGLSPADVEILGELDDKITDTSPYIISPFVGLIPYPYQFRPDHWETEELIEVPVSALQDKNCFSEGKVASEGREIDSYIYKYDGRIIWGATARILNQLLEIIAG